MLISLGLGYGLWQGEIARAQEALLSALSLDSIVEAQANTPVIHQMSQPHLGPVFFSFNPYSSFAFDNNINLSQNNPESDAYIGIGLDLGFFWLATGQSQLNFTSDVGYEFYLKHRDNDYIEIAPGSALTWNFSIDDCDLTFFDQFNYTRNVVSVAAVSNVSGIPIINNTAGLRAQWQPDQWLIQAGYSYNSYFSDSSAYAYLDNASHYFFARGAWRFAEAAQLGLEASASITDYDQQSQSGNTSYSLGPYLEWQVTRFIHASLHGGPTFFSFAGNSSGQSASSLGTYYINFDLTHQITPFISQELSVDRSVNLGYTQGTAYTKQLNIGYTIHWRLKPWLNFWLSLNYQDGQQPLLVGSIKEINEDFARYGVNPGISYQVTQKLTTSLSYSHWTRSSNINGNGYADDNITLQFQYSF
jgi:hypothetical protein